MVHIYLFTLLILWPHLRNWALFWKPNVSALVQSGKRLPGNIAMFEKFGLFITQKTFSVKKYFCKEMKEIGIPDSQLQLYCRIQVLSFCWKDEGLRFQKEGRLPELYNKWALETNTYSGFFYKHSSNRGSPI